LIEGEKVALLDIDQEEKATATSHLTMNKQRGSHK